ncbi:M48 family metalloprotease [Teichococcus aestuarii]|uniref:M48 family metalloprotease n=1 Tax=Teichococcus aestuarii TaxID=568898 RepID=UPI00361EC0BB
MRPALPLLLCLPLLACAQAVYEVPVATPAGLQAAASEIGQGAAPGRRNLSEDEAKAAITRVARRLAPAGTAVCQEIGRGAGCEWRFVYDPSTDLNAAATGEGVIVVQRGVADYARNDAEIAFVVAHEMAHHAADHVRSTQSRAQAGAALGGILASLAGAYAGLETGQLAQTASGVGAQLGVISYSKAQEREADVLGAAILHRAGYDIGEARDMLLTLARLSGRTETSRLSTHPAGPDRIASFDGAVEELRASNWRLAPRR